MVHEAQAEHEMACQLLMDDLLTVHHERVVGVVQPDLESKPEMSLTVRRARRNAVSCQLGRSKLIEVDLV
jgi:hypothetical protein